MKYTKLINQINEFIENIGKKHGQFRVIFTGAGTSAYVKVKQYFHTLRKNQI